MILSVTVTGYAQEVATPMALDQSALTELLDALKAGGDLDFMRRAMEVVLQLLIELEATEKIGAGRYERTDTSSSLRRPCPGRCDGRSSNAAWPGRPPGCPVPTASRCTTSTSPTLPEVHSRSTPVPGPLTR